MAAESFFLCLAVLAQADVPASASTTWERLGQTDGVLVEVATIEGRLILRSRTDLAVPRADVATVLEDIAGFARWIPTLEGWRVIAEDDVIAAYGRHELPWPFDARDYVVRYQVRDTPERFTVEARSTTHPRFPIRKDAVRVQGMWSRWELTTVGAKTRVTYTYDGALTGIPTFLLRRTWQSEGPALLKALSGEVSRRRAASPSPGAESSP